ncbi:DUF2975 domain-containing protein [Ornithobacterium rhinotracheale]|uniref:DUF2975 domain-containing protein n=1 Tax=Ornithobacterium rhinotracheale TaxID=28251 RepID=UPI00129CB1EE|nr:DUF2975 domain-containing protein [Ornithobacterium rhinotracheale]MRJ08010.1 DUF2975 domain-containing protein [Ornithobacterium rhinotracheale]UOH78482.1 DUF2975 domain-containing protein [Ornithobacterium rhinotracheale]
MNNRVNLFFKVLLDFLFLAMVLRVLDIILIFFEHPIDAIILKENELWHPVDWVMLFFTLVGYVIFLFGVFKLRVIGRELIENKLFSDSMIKSLGRSGNYFIISGAIVFFVDVFLLIDNYLNGAEPVFAFAIFDPLLQLIVGLFFKIQGRTLSEAKIYKEDYDLTI